VFTEHPNITKELVTTSTANSQQHPVINQHHFHYYHHYHHHYNDQTTSTTTPPGKLTSSRAVSYDLNKLAETNLIKSTKRNRSEDSFTSSENTSSTSGRFSYLSSSNSPNDITSNFENDFAVLTVNTSLNTNDHCLLNRVFKTETDMEDLQNLINDSLSQWACAYSLFIKIKSTVLLPRRQVGQQCEPERVNLQYRSSLLTSSNSQNCDQMSITNKLKKSVSWNKIDRIFFEFHLKHESLFFS